MNEELGNRLRRLAIELNMVADELAEGLCSRCSTRLNKQKMLPPDDINRLIPMIKGLEFTTIDEVRVMLGLEPNDVNAALIARSLRSIGYMPKTRRFGAEVKRVWMKTRSQEL